MANFSENYGLDFLMKDETALGFVGYTVKEGKAFTSYYGYPYYYKPFGDVEYWISTEKNQDGNLEVSGIDTHCGGNCIWNMRYSGIDITPKDAPKLKRVLMFNRADGTGGLLPIDLITADVLPSFLEGDPITMQVIGLPLEINYYADEDEYAANQPSDKNGKKWMVANGELFPLSFLANHNTKNHESGKNYDSDSYINFTATVTNLYYGTFDLNEDKNDTFIRCLVDTKYGTLELDHTIDQINENQRKNIKVGAVVSGVCILSGDVAIYEYENGAIKDFEHNLQLLRYTLVKGDPERLKSVLTTSTIYSTETTGEELVGADRIIERINYVHENRENEYYANFATITTVDAELDYPVGTRCIVLSPGKEENYESIVFIDVNEVGIIERIKVSTDKRYHFKVDEQPKLPSFFDNIKIPDSVVEPILLRAKLHGIVDQDCSKNMISEKTEGYYMYEDSAQKMLGALSDNPQPDVEATLRNVFGYLFAKSIEMAYNDEHSAETRKGFVVSYCPTDAFGGTITSTLDAEKHVKLEAALELGKQFYSDFSGYLLLHEPDGDDFSETINLALITVQWIGRQYMKKCFE